ncbi:hypothetical protein ACHAXT_000468 [Thalassiosira profunda]
MVSPTRALAIAVTACLLIQCASFTLQRIPTAKCDAIIHQVMAEAPTSPPAMSSIDPSNVAASPEYCNLRRSILANSLGLCITAGIGVPNAAVAADGKLAGILGQIKEAQGQLEAIPDLIKAKKWDAVREILIKPPLSDMWTSGGSVKLLNNYADAIGSELPDGDELAALELREEVISHLRYLDMAVYNNVFNPIATEGETGATKELVRSYYEDPINEWKASKAAVDGLIGLASP